MLTRVLGWLFRISGARYLIYSVDGCMKFPTIFSGFYIVDFDITIFIAPESTLTKTLSGVKVWIMKPESSRSFTARVMFEIINANFLESILSIIYCCFILSNRSAIKVDSNLHIPWGFSETILEIKPVWGLWIIAKTF